MTFLADPIAPTVPPHRARMATPHTVRADDDLTSVIVLSNGAELELAGWAGSIWYPPNYLADLRAGRL